MVSGFLTSPLDQDRMASGDATEIATYSTWLTLSRPSNSRALSFVLIILLFLVAGGAAQICCFVKWSPLKGQSEPRAPSVDPAGSNSRPSRPAPVTAFPSPAR